MLISDPTEKAEWRKFADRVEAVGPYAKTLTTRRDRGRQHRRRAVRASRSGDAGVVGDAAARLPPPSGAGVPVDVPPWWRMKKKNAMFYDGAGRGDHARIMMTASTLCTDDVAEAQAIDAYFGDVRAWIASLEPPPYPFADRRDARGARQGRVRARVRRVPRHATATAAPIRTCSFPSRRSAPIRRSAAGAAQFADASSQWFATSFYGQTSRLEPQPAYIAPPLDGIWATAPYLHNGSVPTLAALLDSSKRPTTGSARHRRRSATTSTARGRLAIRRRHASRRRRPARASTTRRARLRQRRPHLRRRAQRRRSRGAPRVPEDAL